MYCVNAAETHETSCQESGMRYQLIPEPTAYAGIAA